MKVASESVLYKTGKSNGARQSSRRHFRCGVRAAVLRAMSAARTYLREGGNITLEEAAARHGSGVVYVRAAITLIKSADEGRINAVLRGDIPIVAAAKMVEPLVQLLDGYSKATPANKGAFFAITGDLGLHLAASSATERTEGAKQFGNAEAIWEQMVLPLVQAAE